MNLVELLEDNLQRYGTYTSLIYEGQEYSNVDHDRRSSQWANRLQKLGVQQGDRVIVTIPNRPEVFFIYSAIAKLGAITVPVMPLLQAEEVRYIANDCLPKVVVTCQLLLSKVHDAVAGLAYAPIVLSVDDEYLTSFVEKEETRVAPIPIADDDICVILYTSGTTGRPKGVELTHGNLYSNAKAASDLAIDFAVNEQARVGLLLLPLSHAFGYTIMNTALLLGERQVMLPYFDPVAVFKAIEKYQVTYFSAVPAMFHALLNHPQADAYNTTSLTLCISGSAPLPRSVIEGFQNKFHCVIFEGYGLSEAAPIVTAPRFDRPTKPGSVGLPLPGVALKVVDEQGNEVPAGEVGELWVKGPNVTLGYHNLPDESARVLRDGWLCTGDMAKIDEEGYVFIVDRKKDVIIRGGFNVYPRDLEELLLRHPAVSEVAVIGVPSEAMGEEVIAYVVRKPGIASTEEELIAYCQEHLAKYKTPREIRFIGYLPKTLIGKVDKKQLRQQA